MEVLQTQLLKEYTSMRLGGPATYVIVAHTEEDVVQAAAFAEQHNVSLITLGDGTNVVFSDAGYNGVVLRNKIKGMHIEPNGLVTIGAGENWDSVVAQTVAAGFCGIEALSLVPGTAGATPVNNVGAYGQEIADTLISVRAYDTHFKTFIELSKDDCGFSYRQSRFKTTDHGRFIITQITLQLTPVSENYTAPSYPSLTSALSNARPTPELVRNAVSAVRTNKLPDPKKIANVGSFFKNALVTGEAAKALKEKYTDIPIYQTGDIYKIASGWLIEQAGLRNYRANGIWVYDKQALVLVNESAQSFTDLKNTYEHIQKVVFDTFGVHIEPEPELL